MGEGRDDGLSKDIAAALERLARLIVQDAEQAPAPTGPKPCVECGSTSYTMITGDGRCGPCWQKRP